MDFFTESETSFTMTPNLVSANLLATKMHED